MPGDAQILPDIVALLNLCNVLFYIVFHMQFAGVDVSFSN